MVQSMHELLGAAAELGVRVALDAAPGARLTSSASGQWRGECSKRSQHVERQIHHWAAPTSHDQRGDGRERVGSSSENVAARSGLDGRDAVCSRGTTVPIGSHRSAAGPTRPTVPTMSRERMRPRSTTLGVRSGSRPERDAHLGVAGGLTRLWMCPNETARTGWSRPGVGWWRSRPSSRSGGRCGRRRRTSRT